MLKQIFIVATISIVPISAGTLQTKIKELEKRIEKLEKQLASSQAHTKMNRKSTCPETCNCGPNCGCTDCKCGVK